MVLKYTGHTLSGEVIDKITKVCKQHDFPLDYAITLLHFEGLWGNSEVARLNNNWGGMTWTGDPLRPSGIRVSKGTARPANEGGHYMRYASVDDFLQDWAYLLRDGGIYKVSGAKTFDEAVKGMFKVGGAKYDYAASGYTHYLTGMRARRDAINKANNGRLDSLVKNSKNNQEVKGEMATAQQVINEAKKYVGANKYSATHKAIINHYNTQTSLPRGTRMTYDWDWCAAFVSFILMKVGLSKLYGTEISVGYYKDKFIKAGIWKGRVRPQVGDIIIWHWDGSQNGWPHHIGFVSAVSGDTITTLEGNTFKGGVSTVGYNTFKWNASTIQGYARPNYGQATLPNTTLTFEQAVQAVIKGTMGNGSTRVANIKASGQDPVKVQAEVNKRLSNVTTPTPTKTKEQAVKDVISGKYGSGKERHDKLTSEGFNADEIQAMVNKALKPQVDFSGHKNTIKLSKDLEILTKVGGTRRGLAKSGTTIKFDEVYVNKGLFIAYLNGDGHRCYIKIAEMDGNKVKELYGTVSKA